MSATESSEVVSACRADTPDCEQIRLSLSRVVEQVAAEQWTRSPASGKILLAELTQLRADLRRHVTEAEGPGGLVQCVQKQCPWMDQRAEKLMREHAALDEWLAGLEMMLRQCDGADPGQCAAVRKSAAELLQSLRAHQEAGNTLVLDAYWTDLGVKG